MKKKLFFYLQLSLIAILLVGCAKPDNNRPYVCIPALKNSPGSMGRPKNYIRYGAIQEIAMSFGAQGGLAFRAHQLNEITQCQAANLDQIFNFNALMLKHNVLPPVLAEGQMTLNKANPFTLRLADRVFKIVQNPQFVTTPPTWRDYLYLNYTAPETPNITLLPKNELERQIWNRYVTIGWNAGVQQANEIFNADLARLKRDFDGMILYRKLLAQNMVTPPFVAKVDLGVTGNSRYMRVNDQVLRITSTSKLNTNSRTWRAVVRPGEAGGEDPDADQAAPPIQ